MSSVEIERPRPQVAILRLNRPECLNALSWGLVSELHEALDALDRDNRCRVVVLTGAGRGFCAGLDLRDQGNPGEIVAAASRSRSAATCASRRARRGCARSSSASASRAATSASRGCCRG
jgi:enoyl-CoA hydratase/carnithine racemase